MVLKDLLVLLLKFLNILVVVGEGLCYTQLYSGLTSCPFLKDDIWWWSRDFMQCSDTKIESVACKTSSPTHLNSCMIYQSSFLNILILIFCFHFLLFISFSLTLFHLSGWTNSKILKSEVNLFHFFYSLWAARKTVLLDIHPFNCHKIWNHRNSFDHS